MPKITINSNEKSSITLLDISIPSNEKYDYIIEDSVLVLDFYINEHIVGIDVVEIQDQSNAKLELHLYTPVKKITVNSKNHLTIYNNCSDQKILPNIEIGNDSTVIIKEHNLIINKLAMGQNSHLSFMQNHTNYKIDTKKQLTVVNLELVFVNLNVMKKEIHRQFETLEKKENLLKLHNQYLEDHKDLLESITPPLETDPYLGTYIEYDSPMVIPIGKDDFSNEADHCFSGIFQSM